MIIIVWIDKISGLPTAYNRINRHYNSYFEWFKHCVSVPYGFSYQREALIMFTNCNSFLQALFCDGYKTFGIIIHVTKKKGLRQVAMKAVDIYLNYKSLL